MFTKFKTVLLVILFAASLVFVTGQAALAGLAAVGPTNPVTGFPEWYQDTTGLQLSLCIDNSGLCIQDPVDPANATSVASGFGEEAFWWAADALIDDPASGMTGIVVLATEAAYGGGPAAPNDQVSFARVRIRLDVPAIGDYTVVHPFGTRNFNVAALIAGNEINETQDIGAFPIPGQPRDFTGPLSDLTPVNPFLTWPDFLNDPTLLSPVTGARYIGNPAIEHTVTGSPTGNNFVQITGPGINFTQTLFAVQGKVFAPAPPAVPDAATFTRVAAGGGTITVNFNAPGGALQVTVSGVGAVLPGEPVAMSAVVGGPPGLVSATIPFAATDLLPATVAVSVDGVVQPAIPLTDAVTITLTAFDPATSTLTIAASSGDQLAPVPTLTLTDPAGLVPNTIDPATGTLTVPDLLAAPANVTVTSTGGGAATAPVPFNAAGAGNGGVVGDGAGGGGGGCFISTAVFGFGD